jgi:hypothetical protein
LTKTEINGSINLERGCTMDLIYMVTTDDYKKFVQKAAKSRIRKKSLIGTIVFWALLMVVGIWLEAPQKILVWILAVSVIYGGFLVLLLNIKLSRSIKKSIEKAGELFFNSEKFVALNDDGIEMKSNIRDTKVPYDSIKQVTEDKEFISIEFKVGDQIFIPVNQIQNIESKDEFIASLRSKI